VTSMAYPLWFALSACCAAASGRMLMTSFRKVSLLMPNRYHEAPAPSW
jgi:hypothetical protein